ncbi:MAG: esterase, partial [Pseudomonadota bacterium]
MTRLNLLNKVREYLARQRRKLEPIVNTDGLGEFIDTRSSLVAQTSLYGYIKTRAGTRFPDLFENEEFLRSINIAKWQIWAACVSDLAVFSGGLLYREMP